MLDIRRLGVDHARHEHLVRAQAARRVLRVLVRVARVARLDEKVLGLEHGDVRPHERRGDVAVVRAGVVAPAHVHAHLRLVDVHERLVHRRDVKCEDVAELVVGRLGEARVAAHCEVGAVDLQHDAARRDRLVLGPHRVGERVDERRIVGRAEVAVLAEAGERAGRGRRPEDARERPVANGRDKRVERACGGERWHTHFFTGCPR